MKNPFLKLFLYVFTFLASSHAFADTGRVSLSSSAVSISQSSGSVTLIVWRSGTISTSAQVSYATSDGSARAGTDYSAKAGIFTWAANDSSFRSITVPVSTAAFGGTKTFTVSLSNPSGATLSAPGASTVSINGAGAASSSSSSASSVSSSSSSSTAASGTLSLGSSAYTVAPTTGAVVSIAVSRSGGTSGAASVAYATVNGTAYAGSDYTYAGGKLSWAAGDASVKTIKVPILGASAAGKSFTLGLSSPGGATLGSVKTATISINAVTVSSLALASSTYTVQQAAGSLTMSVSRSGGSSGAVSVSYATADSTAKAGTDYTARSGTLSWASGDTAAKTVVVPINSATPFSGSKAFTLSVSNPTGGATLGATTSAVTTINGSGATSTACAKNSSSWVTSGLYDYKQFGNYIVNNNNWGNLPNQTMWANSASCWGVTTGATSERYSIGSYPNVTRGWDPPAVQALSTPGTNDWTTKSGMGIAVTSLTKAKARWTFTAPPAPGARWLGLQDIYFHKSPNPSPYEFPPVVDLMINQALADQVINQTTYYAMVAGNSHASTVTIGGTRYLVIIDEPGEAAFHQAGGHNIHLFATPTSYTDNSGPNWGTQDGTTDIAAVVAFFRQANPKDDAGVPLKNAAGAVVTSPLITADLYLNAINAGWEIDFGTSFTNTKFCVAMQAEPDCQ